MLTGGRGEHDYNDVQMFQSSNFISTQHRLCFKWNIDPQQLLSMLIINQELFVFLEMVASEIPQLRSFVNNYFMLISEMLVKV